MQTAADEYATYLFLRGEGPKPDFPPMPADKRAALDRATAQIAAMERAFVTKSPEASAQMSIRLAKGAIRQARNAVTPKERESFRRLAVVYRKAAKREFAKVRAAARSDWFAIAKDIVVPAPATLGRAA